jgi:hypothetical protein
MIRRRMLACIGRISYRPSVDSKTSLLWADVWVAPSGDITGATDSAAFAAPHSACAVGGKIHLKNGIYYTNAAWVISKALNVEGQSFHASPGSITSGGGANGPTLPSQLTGVVITQVTAATDILQLTGSGVHNDLENLGPTFGASILNTNTGHGVNSSPTALYPAGSGPGHETGQWGSQWRNVLVLGHDGNHYGFVRNNTILVRDDHCRTFGGGRFLEISLPGHTVYGNIVSTDPYAMVYNAGTADGYAKKSSPTPGAAV